MAEVIAKTSGAPDKSVEELEKERAWWWAAEKTRSPRLDYLRKALWKKGQIGGMHPEGLKIELDAPRLYMESWEMSRGNCDMKRRAMATAHILENKKIFITDHAQLVGYYGSLPHTLYFDGSGGSADTALARPGILPEPEEESKKYVIEVQEYWHKEMAGSRQSERAFLDYFNTEDLVKQQSGSLCWGAPLPVGYSNKDYGWYPRGFKYIVADIDRYLDDAYNLVKTGTATPDLFPLYEKIKNWEAMIIALEAMMTHAKRYARLARIVAENFEPDPKRKEELLRVAETCERVPAEPPRTLHESLQLDCFMQACMWTEQFEGAWPSRPDYWHWPYYNKDVNIDKRITHDEAVELVGERMIRAAEIGFLGVRWLSQGVQGVVGTWVWTLGGVNDDGSDACNG
ncbi:MAG: pyruvate formate lyase family protein, partial [Dehalococcoidia bacterium]|nr:pyruvate formate lyase family protein [Dehalococcoidia bacterium]